jgi:hypothetical protein
MTSRLSLGTFNLCSGRGPRGEISDPELGAAIAALDVDVLAVQELDHQQPRSALSPQLQTVAAAMGATSARMQPTLRGEPGPSGWQALPPPTDTLDDDLPPGPLYGIGLISRLPVQSWYALGLGSSRASLPFPIAQPGQRRPQILWVPDEPRVDRRRPHHGDQYPFVVCPGGRHPPAAAPNILGRDLTRPTDFGRRSEPARVGASPDQWLAPIGRPTYLPSRWASATTRPPPDRWALPQRDGSTEYPSRDFGPPTRHRRLLPSRSRESVRIR